MQVGLATENDYMHVMSARLFACSRAGAAELRADGTAARTLLTQYFPDAVEAHTALTDVWATLEAKAGNATEARELCWRPLLQAKSAQARRDVHKRYAWWEVQWGAIASLREHYREVLGRKRGGLPAEARREAAVAWVRAEERYGGVREEMEARRALHALSAGAAGGDDAAATSGKAEGEKRKHGGSTDGADGQGAKRAKTGDAGGAGGAAAAGGGAAAEAAVAQREYDDRFTVFVKHLHEQVTEADLKTLFEVRIAPSMGPPLVCLGWFL